MHRFSACVLMIAVILVSSSCGREPVPPAPSHVNQPQPTEGPREPLIKADTEGVLPNDWYVDTNDKNGTMLLNFTSEEDIWIIINLTRATPGHNVHQAQEYHRAEIEEASDSEYRDGGKVDTPTLGSAAWSHTIFQEEETTVDEISLFVRHPARQAIVVLKYLSPSTFSDPGAKLNELIEVAEVIAPSI